MTKLDYVIMSVYSEKNALYTRLIENSLRNIY